MRRRIDEWGRIVGKLPPLDRAYQIDFRLLSDRLGEIPDNVNGVLKLFDGRRTLAQVLDEVDHDALAAANTLAKLWLEQVIRPAVGGPAGAAQQPALPRAEGEGQSGATELAEWFAGPAEVPPLPPSPAGRAARRGRVAPAPDSPPRIVRFPAKRKEQRPPLQIETTSMHPLPPARAPAMEPRASPGAAPLRRPAPAKVAPRARSLTTALWLAAAVLAGVGIWRIVAGAPDAPAGNGAAAAVTPAAPSTAPAPSQTRAPGKGER